MGGHDLGSSVPRIVRTRARTEFFVPWHEPIVPSIARCEKKDKDIKTVFKHLKTLWYDDEAASAVEYGLLVALIAAVIIIAVTAIGTNLSAKFTEVASKLQ